MKRIFCPLLSFKVLIICILTLLFCISCKSGTPGQKSKGTTKTEHGESEIVLSHGKVVFPDNLQIDKDYVGKMGKTDYLVRFDSVTPAYVSGICYDLTTDSIASSIHFTCTAHHKKVAVRFTKLQQYGNGISEVMVKKVSFAATDSTFHGYYTLGDKQQSFKFALYKEPEFKKFKARYLEKCYDYEVIKDVVYGKAKGYWTENVVSTDDKYFKIFTDGMKAIRELKDLNLTMDLYLPTNDYLKERPLIVFIHGGAYFIGSKTDIPIVLWCKHYAELGYAVASINYRMGFRPTQASIERCGYAAVQDAHAALRYLVHNKDKYRINPDYIFVAGSSAGSITALNLAFMSNASRPASSKADKKNPDMGGIETSGNGLTSTFKIHAIANMWGAVTDLNLLKNSHTDIISFHGDADHIVPHDYALPFQDVKLGLNKLLFNKMYGSTCISQKARELGYKEEMHLLHGSGHAPHVNKQNQPTDIFYFIQDKTTNFFYKEINPQNVPIRKSGQQTYRLGYYNIEGTYWKAIGGIVLQHNNSSARIVWFSDAPKHILEVSSYLKNGTTIYEVKEF